MMVALTNVTAGYKVLTHVKHMFMLSIDVDMYRSCQALTGCSSIGLNSKVF